jgi:hypothetical protein
MPLPFAPVVARSPSAKMRARSAVAIPGPLKHRRMRNKLRRRRCVTPASGDIDALHVYPRLADAGDTGTSELHPLPLRREVLKCRVGPLLK